MRRGVWCQIWRPQRILGRPIRDKPRRTRLKSKAAKKTRRKNGRDRRRTPNVNAFSWKVGPSADLRLFAADFRGNGPWFRRSAGVRRRMDAVSRSQRPGPIRTDGPAHPLERRQRRRLEGARRRIGLVIAGRRRQSHLGHHGHRQRPFAARPVPGVQYGQDRLGRRGFCPGEPRPRECQKLARIAEPGGRPRPRLRPLRCDGNGLPGGRHGENLVAARRPRRRPQGGTGQLADPLRQPAHRELRRAGSAIRRGPRQTDREARLEIDAIGPVHLRSRRPQSLFDPRVDRRWRETATRQRRGQPVQRARSADRCEIGACNTRVSPTFRCRSSTGIAC